MEQFLWVEQYRPRDIESCVLPKTLKNSLQSFVDKETLPNLILSGGPGVGKTTAARAMLEQIGATYMFINGSEESGIDVLRVKIKNFASTLSKSTVNATSLAWVHRRVPQELWIHPNL